MCVAKIRLTCCLLFALALVCVGYLVCGATADEYKIVETISGQVRGVRNSTLFRNIPFYSFKGIPYAKPPIDDLRLKAPEPVESWAPAIFDAFEHGKVCIQPGIFLPQPLPQSEDCLTLNIFVPANVKPNEKLAVLFYIHGGGFISGSSDDVFYGPDFIIEKQTILVTFNYRLGVLGFLSFNSPEYSGNMALKDQQLALKWVSSNIDRFGGDSKRITIFGHSAGGGSTHFQVLSAESRKYFRNAIPMSGSANNYWSLFEEDHLKLAHNIAEELGEPKESNEELVEFFKTVSAEKIRDYARLELLGQSLFSISFAPIVEKKDAKQPFLVESPEEVYEMSNIETNTMFTVTSAEIISLIPKYNISTLKNLDADFNVPLPFHGLDLPLDSKEYRSLNNEVRQFYFGDAAINEQAIPQYYGYLSDVNFVYGIDKSVKTSATKSKGNTFYTWFSIDSTLNVFKYMDIFNQIEMVKLPGAAHGDELCYLFRCHIAQELYDQINNNEHDEQSKISHRTIEYITKLFTNFAKYDNPTHQNDPVNGFYPVQNGYINFLNVSNDGLTPGLHPKQKVMNFWTNIERRARKMSAERSVKNRDEF